MMNTFENKTIKYYKNHIIRWFPKVSKVVFEVFMTLFMYDHWHMGFGFKCSQIDQEASLIDLEILTKCMKDHG